MQIILNFKNQRVVTEWIAAYFIFSANESGEKEDKWQAGFAGGKTDETGLRIDLIFYDSNRNVRKWSIFLPDVPFFVETVIECISFTLKAGYPLQEDGMAVPVKSRILRGMPDRIVPEQEAVYRFGIYKGRIESFEQIVLDYNPTVEVRFLPFQIGYLRINGNNGIGELEKIGKRIDKPVVTDGNIPAGTGFEPAVAIAA